MLGQKLKIANFCCFFPSRRAVSHKKMKILSPGPPTGRAFQFSKGVPLYPPTYLPAFTVYCVVSVCVCVLVPISLNIQLSMRMCMRRAVGALLQSILVLAIDFSFSFQKNDEFTSKRSCKQKCVVDLTFSRCSRAEPQNEAFLFDITFLFFII